MDLLIPKAIWGFNGTERPGAVYLAATLAGHNQKGLPANPIRSHLFIQVYIVCVCVLIILAIAGTPMPSWLNNKAWHR